MMAPAKRKPGPPKRLDERVNVWLPAALMDHVRTLANEEDRTIASMIRRLLQKAVTPKVDVEPPLAPAAPAAPPRRV